MNDAVCYCIQEPSPHRDVATGVMVPRDLSSAARYGRLEFLFNQEEKPSLTPGPAYFKLHKKLREFRPEKDYIFHAGGDTLACGLVFAALADLGAERISWLRWERERGLDGERIKGAGFYVPVSVKIKFYTKEKGEEVEQGELF